MTVRELEKALRRRCQLSRSQARIVISRGKRWRWLSFVSVRLFAWVVARWAM